MNDTDFLDNLFAGARRSEPYLEATPFTENLMAELPTIATEQVSPLLANAITLLFTAIGGLLAFWLLPLDNTLDAISTQASFVITPALLGYTLAAICSSCVGAWWYIEQKD